MKILLAAFMVFEGMLIYRLADLQVRNSEGFQQPTSAQERVPLKPISGSRARILARGPAGNGTVVTTCFCFLREYAGLDCRVTPNKILKARENDWRCVDKKPEKMFNMQSIWDLEEIVAETTKGCEARKWL